MSLSENQKIEEKIKVKGCLLEIIYALVYLGVGTGREKVQAVPAESHEALGG